MIIIRKIYILLIFLLISLLSQAQLNYKHNSLRSGDVIIKQQVEFKKSILSDTAFIWDLRELGPISEEYKLTYEKPPLIADSVYVMGYDEFPKKEMKKKDLIVGTEHNTLYYYCQTMDSLTMLGFENVAVKQKNLQPIINLRFPLNYKDQVFSEYETKGISSGEANITSKGIINISADSFGKMILPTGDTINPVLRVKTRQSLINTTEGVISELKYNDKGRTLNTYKWYTKGYRYPIFEAIECIDLNTDSIIFSTAFYFPPQDHLYLNTDPENLALLDSLWDFSDKQTKIAKESDLHIDNNIISKYKIYPNPVVDNLNIEYSLIKESSVNIIIVALNGKIVKNVLNKGKAGFQKEQINCSSFVAGVYMLKIIADNVIIDEKIIKK